MLAYGPLVYSPAGTVRENLWLPLTTCSFAVRREGPFSIFAWVHGGAPGQVIVSQPGGANWLMADPAMAGLMTDLKCGGRCAKLAKRCARMRSLLRVPGIASASPEMAPGAVFTRMMSLWPKTHRIAWRILRAASSSAAARAWPAGTFWIGLIDDVRIYHRAVKP